MSSRSSLWDSSSGNAVAGSVDGYKYSTGMKTLHDEGLVWNAETLAQYLPSPKDMVENGYNGEVIAAYVDLQLDKAGLGDLLRNRKALA